MAAKSKNIMSRYRTFMRRAIDSLGSIGDFAWPDMTSKVHPQVPCTGSTPADEHYTLGSVERPIRLWWRGVPRLADFYLLTRPGCILVRGRVRREWKRHGISGAIFKRVITEDRTPKKWRAFTAAEMPDSVWELSARPGYRIAPDSGIVLRELCPVCKFTLWERGNKRPVKIESISGVSPDIALIENTGVLVLSERLVDLCAERDFSLFLTHDLQTEFEIAVDPPKREKYFARLTKEFPKLRKRWSEGPIPE